MGSCSVNAQLDYGVKVNYHYFLNRAEIDFIGPNENFPDYKLDFSSYKPGYSGGIYGHYTAGWLFAHGELLYSTFEGKFDVLALNDDVDANGTYTDKYTFIDIPALGGIVVNDMNIGVGPILHIHAGLEDGLDGQQFYNRYDRTISFGFQGIFQYHLGRAFVDLKFESTFRSVGDHIIYDNKQSSRFLTSPYLVTLGLGFRISR